MSRAKWAVVLAACMVLAVLAMVTVPADARLRTHPRPGMPDLNTLVPEAVVSARHLEPPTKFALSRVQLADAIERGRKLAAGDQKEDEVLEPWRQVVSWDRTSGALGAGRIGLEWATVITPEAIASMLGWRAERLHWPEEELEKQLDAALLHFRGGICIYIQLRSYAHESRGGWIFADQIIPGTPEEVYEADFLLRVNDTGRSWQAASAQMSHTSTGTMGVTTLTSNPLYYQLVTVEANSYAANYYAWWPFADEDGEQTLPQDIRRLTLTIVTPNRGRDYTWTFGEALRREVEGGRSAAGGE